MNNFNDNLTSTGGLDEWATPVANVDTAPTPNTNSDGKAKLRKPKRHSKKDD